MSPEAVVLVFNSDRNNTPSSTQYIIKLLIFDHLINKKQTITIASVCIFQYERLHIFSHVKSHLYFFFYILSGHVLVESFPCFEDLISFIKQFINLMGCSLIFLFGSYWFVRTLYIIDLSSLSYYSELVLCLWNIFNHMKIFTFYNGKLIFFNFTHTEKFSITFLLSFPYGLQNQHYPRPPISNWCFISECFPNYRII